MKLLSLPTVCYLLTVSSKLMDPANKRKMSKIKFKVKSERAEWFEQFYGFVVFLYRPRMSDGEPFEKSKQRKTSL